MCVYIDIMMTIIMIIIIITISSSLSQMCQDGDADPANEHVFHSLVCKCHQAQPLTRAAATKYSKRASQRRGPPRPRQEPHEQVLQPEDTRGNSTPTI